MWKIKTCSSCGERIKTGEKCRSCSHKNKTFNEAVRNRMRRNKLGTYNPNWNGGRKTKSGYFQVLSPSHPFADSRGYVQEHRLNVEKKIGRYLTPEEVVHHIDFNRGNNNIDNLMLFESDKAHQKFHTKIRQFGMTNPIKREIENQGMVNYFAFAHSIAPDTIYKGIN